MESLSEPADRIVASAIPERDRMTFLPEKFGSLFMYAEREAFSTLKRLHAAYEGAYWHFYALSNGGYYMAPEMDRHLALTVDTNQYRGEVSPDAAGVIVCLFVLNKLAWHHDRFIEPFYQLRAFAVEHAESRQILAAID